MARSGLIVTGLVGLALVIGAIVITMRKSSNSQATNNTAATPSATTPTDNSSSSDASAVAATITYSDSGFSPSTVTVKAGDTIAIKNVSSQEMQFDSDPHPIHTDDPELNVGTVDAGKTVTFKVQTKGTHGVHNHLDASKTATITVQ